MTILNISVKAAQKADKAKWAMLSKQKDSEK